MSRQGPNYTTNSWQTKRSIKTKVKSVEMMLSMLFLFLQIFFFLKSISSARCNHNPSHHFYPFLSNHRFCPHRRYPGANLAHHPIRPTPPIMTNMPFPWRDNLLGSCPSQTAASFLPNPSSHVPMIDLQDPMSFDRRVAKVYLRHIRRLLRQIRRRERITRRRRKQKYPTQHHHHHHYYHIGNHKNAFIGEPYDYRFDSHERNDKFDSNDESFPEFNCVDCNVWTEKYFPRKTIYKYMIVIEYDTLNGL